LALKSPDGLDNTIICYQPIGVKDIYDFHVPMYKNYIAGGAVHHNTESIGGYEVTCHLTGDYPEWWTGKRFSRPIKAWAVGKTGLKVRDIAQKKLLGENFALGTGVIPGKYLVPKSERSKPGVPNAYESILVKHKSGGNSILVFKAYAEDRGGFEGEEIDVIWLDEEPPLAVFSECLIRLTPKDHRQPFGHLLCTFTPLEGMSDVVMNFLTIDGKTHNFPDNRNGIHNKDRFIISATWDDAPHLTSETKQKMFDNCAPHEREARSRGIPQLGSGAVYPITEEEVSCEDFEIPSWWKRISGLDVGWNITAGIWIAENPDDLCAYLYSVYKKGRAEPIVHAEAINARGLWIPTAIDPASSGSSQVDGRKLIDLYSGLIPSLFYADNAVEAGVFKVWEMLSSGRLKVFKSCLPWFDEFRFYRRNEKGKITKENDHLMDATRYAVMSIQAAQVPPDPDMMDFDSMDYKHASSGWY